MRRYVIFAIVSLTIFMVAINATAVAVALPVLISDLNMSLVLGGWVMSIYQLVAISAMPLAGKLSDTFSRKSVLLICTLLFTIGSLLCAIAPNAYLLIVFRIIQGIGGGGFLPSATGIVSDEFPESRQRAIGLFTSIFPIGGVIGPNLGGWMVEALGWKSIFWLNVPLGLIVLFLSWWLMKAGKSSRGRSIDFIGAMMLTGFLSILMLAFSSMSSKEGGVSWALVSILFVLSIGLVIVFLRWERRVREPIVDMKMLSGKPFMAANIYNFIYGGCAFGIFSLIPLYAVSVYDLSVFQSGLILTPRSIGMMVASTVVSIFLVRWGYRIPMLIGTVLVALILFLLALETQGISLLGIHLNAITLLLIIMALSGVGVGVSAPAANNACIELMPDRIAMITGLRGMFRQMGGAIVITISTLVLHNMGDMHRAFFFCFIALTAVLLLSLPAVFIMPERPEMKPADKPHKAK